MKRVRCLLLGAACLLSAALLGCINPLSMGIATPIPVPPWVTERMEEKFRYPHDFESVIMPPIAPGHRPICEDIPDRQTVLRAMPRVARGVPYIYEEHRDDIEVVVEKLVDVIDPARFFPLIGPAQLHHCHFKCTAAYKETISSGWPFPYYVQRPRVQVVYIDRDHLHMLATTQEALISQTRDLTGIRP